MDLKDKKILFTGCAGFIGNNLGRKLITFNPKSILGIDKMSYMSNDFFYQKESIEVIKEDISNQRINQTIIDYNPDIIINMAAESHVDNSIKNPFPFLKSNVEGVLNLLECSLKMKSMPLFVQISTDEVYGDIEIGDSIETDPRYTSSPYSASKASAEHFVEAYGRTYSLPYVITRSSNNYGPFQDVEKFIPRVICNLLAGKKVPIYGTGQQQRDWIHVNDNCEGILAAIKYSSLHSSDVYNIGVGNQSITNKEIVQKICFLLDKDYDTSVVYVTDRLGHDFRYSLSSSMLYSLTGWQPKINIDLGLCKTIEWYRSC